MADRLVAGGPSPIEKVLYRLLERIKVFLFLVDGSGSVPATGFQTMINTVRSIANRINMEFCYIGVFQYSSKVTPSCTPTSNLKQFHQALDGIVQDRQGNEEALALDAAVKALKECPLAGERLIIHLTDGGLMGKWKEAATNVKYIEKIQIMSIGVGERIDAHNIREFASPELAFFVKDYQELQKMFQFLDLAPLPASVLKPVHEKKVDAREIHLEVEAYPLAADVKGYHVEIVESSDWRSAGFSLKPTITVKDNIRPNTTYTLRTYVELKNGRVSAPSNEITVTTLPPNPHASVAKNLTAAVAARIKDCQEFSFCSASVKMGMEHYNVLIAGVPGAGKSSSMTAVNSMLCGKYQPCGANGEVNETLTRVVTEFEALKKLSVIDTPGIRDENLKLYEKHLYYGGVPSGYDERNPDFTTIRNVDQIPIQEQVHCVVLAVSCETLVDAQIMTMLKQQYEIILKQGRNCIILLTKVDKVDARIKLSEPTTLSLVYESGIVMNFRKSLATHLGLNVDCVLPIVSYNAPINPIPWVSMLHLDWIEKALQMSDGFCSTFLSVEKSKRVKKSYQSTDELMAQIFKDKLGSDSSTPVVPLTNYSAPVTIATAPPKPTPATETHGSVTGVAPVVLTPVAAEDNAEYEILLRREEDPADDWSSIYLRNSDRTTIALKAAICEKYPPRTPASIIKIVEERKIGTNTINKKVESHQDVGHLINSAMKGNMVFVVVSFSVVNK